MTPTADEPIVSLPSGDRVLVRPIRGDDGPALAAGFEQLSAQSRYRRFHSGLPRLSDAMIDYLSNIDHHDHEALVAAVPQTDELVGVARFVRDPDHRDTAEMALVVLDSWQRRGLATLLLRRLGRRAAELGISYFTAEILADNGPTLELVRQLGNAETTGTGGTVTVRMDVIERPDAERNVGSLLRTVAVGKAVLVPRPLRAWLNPSPELTCRFLLPVAAVLDRPRRQ